VLQAVLEKSSKIEMIRHFGALTLPQIIKAKYPSIGMLEKHFGTPKIHNALEVLLHDINLSFKGSLNADEIEEIAAELMVRHRVLSFEDVYFCLQQLKTTKTSYAGLSVNQVLKCFSDYFDKRTTTAAQISLEKHLAQSHDDQTERINKNMLLEDIIKGKTNQVNKLKTHNQKFK
jgi:hypothetical protein